MSVLSTPDGRRMSFSLDVFGKAQEFVSVIERDGAWFVTELGKPPVKCRPHEYPFSLPSFPLFQKRSEALMLVTVERGHLGAFEGTKGSLATYRGPLVPAAALQMRQVVEQAEALVARGGELSPEMRQRVESMRDVLRRGLPAVVDLDNGLLVEHGSMNLMTRIEDFRWLDAPPPGAVAVEGTQWEDRTAGPLGTPGVDPAELVMLLHSPSWRPGLPKQDADGRILDLKSGRIWRVPYPGVGSSPGCFLKGRESVVVTGADPDQGAFGIYRIDLRDGAVRSLGGEALATGIAGPAALSPDGKTLALVHIPSVGMPNVRQVYLVDVETGDAAPLGKPVDLNAIAWLPDGKGLIVVRTDFPDDPRQAWVGMVCRMDSDGTVTELFRGASATVLGGGRLLFEDQSARLWKTCDVSGKDVKLFGDGLKDYFFPAPSPDGRRILFIRNDPSRGPTPYLFNADGTGGAAATKTPGLWATPHWQ